MLLADDKYSTQVNKVQVNKDQEDKNAPAIKTGAF